MGLAAVTENGACQGSKKIDPSVATCGPFQPNLRNIHSQVVQASCQGWLFAFLKHMTRKATLQRECLRGLMINDYRLQRRN
jgi:hypothetical protein